ncbi:MAG: hypothetical protein SVU32_08270 [Candidatus Nanohaloarchaea archaeon]|nr:hypothetical protein [Candidatus Nanohaloarchaea archaeon]
MLGISMLAAVFGDVDRRGYRRMEVAELFQRQPFGEKVVVAGRVERVLQHRDGYGAFLLEHGNETVKVYCSGNLSVAAGARIEVWGTFSTHQGVPEVSTDCFMIRRAGGT